MNEAEATERVGGRPSRTVPWHLWAVGVLTLLWNSYGAYEYLMEMTRNADYMANAGSGLDEVLDNLPMWVTAGWAFAVWASLAGSLLLLLRSRHAQVAYIVALLGAASSFGYQLSEVEIGAAWIMPLVITLVIVGQWLYSRRQVNASVLR